MAAVASLPADGSRPLRIVHCFRSPVGGIFRHVRDLVRAQSAAGHQVGIICDQLTGGEREEALFEEIMPYLALGLQRVPMKRHIAPSDVIAISRVFRRIRVLNPDIIHTHGAKGGVYGRIIGTLLRASGSGVARIYCPHGGSLHYDALTTTGQLYFALERWMERVTDAFVFVSHFEAQAFTEKIGEPTRAWRVATNGVGPQEFELVETAPDAADFLFIGMLRDLKGPDLFIRAIAEIGRLTGNAPTAVIVGDGPDKDRYQALVMGLGLDKTVRFRSAMPARQAFAKARFVVVPSRAESMPYIVLETIAAGRPLIATRVGGIPEIFGAARKRLVPPGEVPALAAAMREFLDEPQKALLEAGALRESIRSRFTVEAMAAVVADIYSRARKPKTPA